MAFKVRQGVSIVRGTARSRPACTSSSSAARRRIATRARRSGRQSRCSAATGRSSASSRRDGSGFESEIWGDVDVMAPGLQSSERLSIAHAAPEGPVDDRGVRRRAAAATRACRCSCRRASASTTRSRRVTTATVAGRAGGVRRDGHGHRRHLRRDEHDVRPGRVAHAGDRHAAGARLLAHGDHAAFIIESAVLGAHRRRRRLPACAAGQLRSRAPPAARTFQKVAFAFRISAVWLVVAVHGGRLMGSSAGCSRRSARRERQSPRRCARRRGPDYRLKAAAYRPVGLQAIKPDAACRL